MKQISDVLKVNSENETVPRIQDQFGRCTQCKEMTSLNDPCCVNVPIEFEGDLVMPDVEDQ